MTQANRAQRAFHDHHPVHDQLAAEVLDGLAQNPAFISPKFFYDAQGSRLFDAITELPEYYPTRTEMAILGSRAVEIAERVGTGALLIEPGGGSCTKVRLLLDALRPAAFVPMDISREHLRAAAAELGADFPWLEVHAAAMDFTEQMVVPDAAPEARRLAFFPGSTIGNFEPESAREFLGRVRAVVGDDGQLLIGVDLKKDPPRLVAAYDDAAGVTAEFNLNLLARLNREFGADFDLDEWHHLARYDEKKGRIEMHLVSARSQSVQVMDQCFDFDAGESIHTENAYKYSVAEFRALAERAGFVSDSVWTDQDELFSVHLLQAG